MAAKNTFIFYETIEEMLLELPDEEYIEFSKAVMKYGLHEIEPEFTGIKKALWTQIKFCIDNSKKFREKQSNNRKGVTKQNQTEPDKTNINQTEPKLTKQDQTQPNVNVNVNENVKEISAEADPKEPRNDLERVEQLYLENYETLYKKGVVKTEKPIINWGQCRKLEKTAIASYGLDTVLDAVQKSMEHEFCIQKGYVLSTILSASVFADLVNGNSWKKKKGYTENQVYDRAYFEGDSPQDDEYIEF